MKKLGLLYEYECGILRGLRDGSTRWGSDIPELRISALSQVQGRRMQNQRAVPLRNEVVDATYPEADGRGRATATI